MLGFRPGTFRHGGPFEQHTENLSKKIIRAYGQENVRFDECLLSLFVVVKQKR